MLFDPTKTLKAGELIKVTFVFAQRDPIDVSFEVKDVIPVTGSSGSPETMDHSQMDHSTMNHGDKKP
jgi:copper(I)-binding protein